MDQSELAWRILSRYYGAQVCVTPMFHARLFSTCAKYRQQVWSTLNCADTSNGTSHIPFHDRPLIVQFCANEPSYLVSAAILVQDHCDAIDLNLGCPQDIARRGHYGSYLMEEWPLIAEMLQSLVQQSKVPITAKIRIFPELEKTLQYVKMLRESGISMLTVHGRLREQKGHKTGLADWQVLKRIKQENQDFPIVANGNILYKEDLEACLKFTGCDAVMSAEGNLYNPAIFSTRNHEEFPRISQLVNQYLDIVKQLETEKSFKTDLSIIKAHLFKLYRPCLSQNGTFKVLRERLGKFGSTEELQSIVKELNNLLEEAEYAPDMDPPESPELPEPSPLNGHTNILVEEIITDLEQEHKRSKQDILDFSISRTTTKKVPFWRCQPYIRPPLLVHSYGSAD